ncbi:eukaryotic translation initiation factor 2-alpha kinase 1 [Syngnathoides biaculeatus]|uniref:eukaryotic translation initiation factor 2-alpha kinase 1 n=1 Tax=Syngnathoides biaculeatus TaxID=300417 RepID=UPI002ADDAF13|nr:eukaryotic translation initiation factor 2-alpha kinase 1 [Syngnathoides biaculeatus]
MYSSTSTNKLFRSDKRSSSSNKLLVPRSRFLKAVSNHDCTSLPSLATQDDDEVHFDTSDSDSNHEVLMAGRRYSSVQEFASAIPNHLLLGSLLEHLCFLYESNPARSRMLFKVIGQRLASINLLSPLAISDEFSTVRLQHNRAFTELIHAASSSLYPQEQEPLNTNADNSAVRLKEGLFQAQMSRYLSEFEEIGRIGKGSYGNVYKVVNKLDGQYYAVKKILIKKVSKDDCMKVLREVKVLSSLQHVNVVGYHTAWMEHVQPTTYAETLLPELTSPAQEDISDEDPERSSSSFSVVFQSISQPQADSCANTTVPPGDGPPAKPLALMQEKGQGLCPNMMRRIPENYVPCVFLGQRGSMKASKCPAVGWDMSSLLEGESSRNSIELNNNNTCEEKKCEQYNNNKDLARPSKEVHLHLMLYIQMQLCERSLKDWMTERNSKPKEEQAPRCPYGCVNAEHTFSLLRKILEGVEYIHSRGIIHRDLKPRNIFLNGHDCHIRIGDFGLACSDLILDTHESALTSLSDSPHTMGVGTFVYASPEQLKSSHYDSKSDMYSIGVLALELFQPFGTEMERVRTLEDLRKGKIPDSFRSRWPVLANYILKLTSHEPSVRPTAAELLQSQLFCNKDVVICGLQKKVEEQEEEILHLRQQIQQLQNSNSPFQNCPSWENT